MLWKQVLSVVASQLGLIAQDNHRWRSRPVKEQKGQQGSRRRTEWKGGPATEQRGSKARRHQGTPAAEDDERNTGSGPQEAVREEVCYAGDVGQAGSRGIVQAGKPAKTRTYSSAILGRQTTGDDDGGDDEGGDDKGDDDDGANEGNCWMVELGRRTGSLRGMLPL
ncbi:hypothetical protein GE09DRAFT_1232434 [Coniochaeta sp. 2T2.1]|nr:hypothetical protein GE09DRAFT_1232434 [Coniochaeta sp. 2T2.1]